MTGDRWQVTGDRWQVTGDMWQVTHDTWNITHRVRWTFSQNFSSLAHPVWDWQCLEDILTKGLLNELINYKESEKSLYFLPIQPCHLCPSTHPVQQKSVHLFQNQGASRLVSRMAHLLLGLLIILPLQTNSGEERSLDWSAQSRDQFLVSHVVKTRQGSPNDNRSYTNYQQGVVIIVS